MSFGVEVKLGIQVAPPLELCPALSVFKIISLKILEHINVA